MSRGVRRGYTQGHHLPRVGWGCLSSMQSLKGCGDGTVTIYFRSSSVSAEPGNLTTQNLWGQQGLTAGKAPFALTLELPGSPGCLGMGLWWQQVDAVVATGTMTQQKESWEGGSARRDSFGDLVEGELREQSQSSLPDISFQVIQSANFYTSSFKKMWVSPKDNDTKFIWLISAKEKHTYTCTRTRTRTGTYKVGDG